MPRTDSAQEIIALRIHYSSPVGEEMEEMWSLLRSGILIWGEPPYLVKDQ